ncbi:MAG: hypothetical protein F6K04_15640 [Leptolyngbya sp. SIO4C5]|uniref:hypothetical protein n=1 Tax=Sphaerothrix gracilis TaxID=3151835 RepID=UPI0013C23397|nr:hypothetical protein [Leptolyngbya sp. SIO4C5]
MKRPNRYSFLFRIACDALRLLAIATFGFLAACLFLMPFGAAALASTLMTNALPFFLQLATCILCIMAIAGFIEALTQQH